MSVRELPILCRFLEAVPSAGKTTLFSKNRPKWVSDQGSLASTDYNCLNVNRLALNFRNSSFFCFNGVKNTFPGINGQYILAKESRKKSGTIFDAKLQSNNYVFSVLEGLSKHTSVIAMLH